jgi:Zn-dependent protease
MIEVFKILGFLIGLIVHEFMHAWTANYLGDSTARYAGRISLSPIPHIDPLGTIILPLLLLVTGSPIIFGWAKPVPINPNNFQNPRLGEALTSIAGPMANFILAGILAAVLKFPGIQGTAWEVFLVSVIGINLILMIFNLIPIPPLDGSKLLAIVFPKLENPKVELYGFFVLLAFLLLGGFSLVVAPIFVFLANNVLDISPLVLQTVF